MSSCYLPLLHLAAIVPSAQAQETKTLDNQQDQQPLDETDTEAHARYLYSKALSGTHEDAMPLLEQAAELKLPEAAFQLGLAHAHGFAGHVDKQKALTYFRSAAEGNLADAKFNLVALCEARPACVASSLELQIDYLGVAAEANHTEASFQLANLLLADEPASALSLFLRAASAGHAAAAYNAGHVLALGRDEHVPADLTRALALFGSAAARVDAPRVADDAITAREALYPRWVGYMSSIDTVELMVRNFAVARVERASEDDANSSEAKCRAMWLEGSLSWAEFQQHFAQLPTYENERANLALARAMSVYSQMVEAGGACCPAGSEFNCLGQLRQWMVLSKLSEGSAALARNQTGLREAARWHERLASTHACRATFAIKETDRSCFNDQLAAAITLRRMAGDDDAVVAALVRAGNAHPHAATHWRLPEQTPRVFHPSLRAQPWWIAGDFAVARALESAWRSGAIARDLERMGILVDGVARVGATVEPGGAAAPAAGAPAAFERIVSTGAPIRGRHQGDDQEGSGVWSEFMLFDGTSWLGERCERASALCEVLRASPEVAGTVTTADGQSVTPQGQVTIFRLRAGAHILPHVGVTNRRLVLQFPLHGIEGVRFRVADVWREYVTGRALVFDDSYEHEIVHGGEYDRYVLYATLHHPELGEPVL